MQEYAQKPEQSSSDSNSRSSGQPPISEILQAYKNGTLQRMSVDEEELLQAKTRDKSSERETLQRYTEYTHRDKSRYNSFIQGMFDIPQRKGIEDEELLQGKFDSSSAASESPVQREVKPNNTGLPDNLKSGIENLSGYSMDDVKVHYNSDKPAQLQALAYAQGTDIHVAPGQENHLPHEAWHVVQQKQGRVQSTMQMQGVDVNDNEGLEREADVIGEKAAQLKNNAKLNLIINKENKLIQAKLKQWKPKTIAHEIENQLLANANKISDAVDTAFYEFMSGNYTGASIEQQKLYVLRKSEYDEYRRTGKPYRMHPATSAGYVIEGKVNTVIDSIPNIDTQAVGLLKGSRPDIVIHTGVQGEGGHELLGIVDITAEKSIGHIFRKSGNWTNHKNIVFVAEVYYPSIDFDKMEMITLTNEQKQEIESTEEVGRLQIAEYNNIRLRDFEEKGNILQQQIMSKEYFTSVTELPKSTLRAKQLFIEKLNYFGFDGGYPDIILYPIRLKNFDELYLKVPHNKTNYSLMKSNELFKELTIRIEDMNFFGSVK